MTSTYVELHAHSFYSFGVGASHTHELIARAKELGYPAIALTDTNLCGALDFARTANSLGIQPITGGEITLNDGSHLTLLAQTRKGYSNLSRLFTCANSSDRKDPHLDPALLPEYAEGITLLTGCRDGKVPSLVSEGRYQEAGKALKEYMEWFGSDGVYVELQQNMVYRDTQRNRELARMAKDVGVPVVATNCVHYHTPERHKLQNALVGIKHNSTMNEAIHSLKPNREFYLKSPAQMERLFRSCPEAVENTVRIAERCTFNLSTDLGYQLPAPPVPKGYTPESYLRRLCYEAAMRRYGTITGKVESRLEDEFRLIGKHSLAGFLLLYREIVLIARELMVEQGVVNPETPLESRPPGRGRGSSVAMLAGYLIGISHVDPLVYNLTLERFLPEELGMLPDIDLDFPRSLRDLLIERIHQRFGPDYAVLTGAIGTYRMKGVIADLGKALGLPKEDLRRLSKSVHSHDAASIEAEMLQLPEFRDRMNSPGWKALVELAPQLQGAPKVLSQHVGGMILSSSPIPEMVPVRQGAIEGRYIMDWDKDSVADARFAKIDILSLPVLDQLDEALGLIEEGTGNRPDLSRISPEDSEVYDMIAQGRSKGVFLLQSPAQLKMGQRLRSRNLLDLAYQVALIRPGVGVQGSAVSQFVERYRHGVAWSYDHELEKRALERGYGIIVWQEQVVQLIMDVAGMSASEADEMRRAFGKRNNDHLIAACWKRFREGARKNGVPEEIARKIFSKINGHYMFPESHSHAFAITAYQAAWLKCHYPIEFFVTLMNNQPMGFYPMEALKQDARRFGVPFLNPDVNASQVKCTIKDDSVLMGLRFVKEVGKESVRAIVEARTRNGSFISIGDFVRRTGLKPQAVESLVIAGAFDTLNSNRRLALWEAGLYPRPTTRQLVLPLSMDDDVPELGDFSDYQKMLGEYAAMGIYPRGHLMEFMRPRLGNNILTTEQVERAGEGDRVVVAGWPIARQHPRGEEGTVFVTIEDETGDTQLILWPKVFARYKRELRNTVLVAKGVISKWDGTTNVIASHIKSIHIPADMPKAHDWR